MAYDADFFDAYNRYVADPIVRRAHDSVLSFAALRHGLHSTLDLGCGQSHEFFNYGHWTSYRGIDLDPGTDETEWFSRGDYRDLDHEVFSDTDYGCFVSLFSTECTAAWWDNKDFYEALFGKIPSLGYGLVSGFYYTSKLTENPIAETGGITSWQTLPGLTTEKLASPLYEEVRVALPVPSKMFGDDVVEVWRFLERK